MLQKRIHANGIDSLLLLLVLFCYVKPPLGLAFHNLISACSFFLDIYQVFPALALPKMLSSTRGHTLYGSLLCCSSPVQSVSPFPVAADTRNTFLLTLAGRVRLLLKFENSPIRTTNSVKQFPTRPTKTPTRCTVRLRHGKI